MLSKHHIRVGPDDHVFIHIECEDRPALSIDITNPHGRRSLGVRVNGMGIFGCLVDVKELGPAGDSSLIHRFCPICGHKIDLVSSRGHVCPEVLEE